MKFLFSLATALLAQTAAANLQNALQAVLNIQSQQQSQSPPPNILLVITDDQDLELDSIDYTPRITRHIRDKGTFYRNHFVTTALCCPSRVSLWTGRQAHNTNVTDVSPPYGKLTRSVHWREILGLLFLLNRWIPEIRKPGIERQFSTNLVTGGWV